MVFTLWAIRNDVYRTASLSLDSYGFSSTHHFTTDPAIPYRLSASAAPISALTFLKSLLPFTFPRCQLERQQGAVACPGPTGAGRAASVCTAAWVSQWRVKQSNYLPRCCCLSFMVTLTWVFLLHSSTNFLKNFGEYNVFDTLLPLFNVAEIHSWVEKSPERVQEQAWTESSHIWITLQEASKRCRTSNFLVDKTFKNMGLISSFRYHLQCFPLFAPSGAYESCQVICFAVKDIMQQG